VKNLDDNNDDDDDTGSVRLDVVVIMILENINELDN